MRLCLLALCLLALCLLLTTAAAAQPTSDAVTGQRVACVNGSAAGFACGGVDLLSMLAPSALGGRGRLNDVWGWTDPDTGREVALVGRTDGTAFVDVTDPVNPVFLGLLPAHGSASIWRDVKVHANHAYVVSEAPGHGMQVFDLTQLRDVPGPPTTFSETAHYATFGSAHNIAINEATGFAYVVGANGAGETCGGGLHMIDLQDPVQPVFAGCFADPATGFARTGYTHDAQCVLYHGPDAEHVGKEICIGANETALSIADVTDKQRPEALSTASYPDFGYVHQGWLSEDHRYFFQDDELDRTPRTRTLVWDLADLDDPQLLTSFLGTTAALDHNQYVVGDYLYQANYTAGLRILDVRDPARPVEVGFFDTYTFGDAPSFRGAWSTYPFFASGTILVTSIDEGLFMVRPLAALQVAREAAAAVPAAFTLSDAYPNPFNPSTHLTLTLPAAQAVTVRIYDVLGRRVAELARGVLGAGRHEVVWEAAGLPGGRYVVRAEGGGTVQTRLLTLVK